MKIYTLPRVTGESAMIEPQRPLADRVTLVVLTHNRADELARTLTQLTQLAADLPIIVVDNGSSDGTPALVASRFPGVRLVRLGENQGAAGRNIGARHATTPYVAFCDDDTWWAPGALARAAELLDAYPQLAAVTGRVLVGARNREDPTSARMAASPLANDLGVPGAIVLGVLAGACMMRRAAFLAAGGYHPRFFLGHEEALLAADLMAAGWRMAYAPDLVVHHYPSPRRDAHARRRMLIRNALWLAWLRRPWPSAIRETMRLAWQACNEPALVPGVLEACRGIGWVARQRRVVPGDVEEALRRVGTFYAAETVSRVLVTQRAEL